jgi:hypothetical protein
VVEEEHGFLDVDVSKGCSLSPNGVPIQMGIK